MVSRITSAIILMSCMLMPTLLAAQSAIAPPEQTIALGAVETDSAGDGDRETEDRTELESIILADEVSESEEAEDTGRQPDIVWNDAEWRRFQKFQYGTLAGMGALIATAFILQPDFTEPRWDSYGPFDDWVRDRVNGGSEGLVKAVGKTSDILYPTLGLLPLVLEDAFMLPLARRSPDVALQTFLIDAQSLAFTSVFYFGGQAIVGRSRPGLSRCIEEDGLDNCRIGTGIKSFFSGHAAIAFTGAGLICTHQAYLGVYNNDTVGRAMCGLTMTAASATAVFRLIANRHWASDVLTGVGLGLFSGLALPRLIHFNPPRLGKRRDSQAVFFMLPDLRPNHVGVTMMSSF